MSSRARSSSIQQVAEYVAHPPKDHHLAHLTPKTPLSSLPPSEGPSPISSRQGSGIFYPQTLSLPIRASFWQDLKTFQWMRRPESSLKLIFFFISSYYAFDFLLPHISPSTTNPIQPFLFLSYPWPLQSQDEGRQKYGKGLLDIPYLIFWTIALSFLRSFSIDYLFRPLGMKAGLRKSKLDRFIEQGYTILYFGTSSALGMLVMSRTSMWWFKTEEFWTTYPMVRMDRYLKAYYLIQFSYWLQQALMLMLKLEKPRSDYLELVAHHIVTLWMIGWSYNIHLTYIGVAVYNTMDIADTFLALGKVFSYVGFELLANTTLAFFLFIWSYFRIYQNVRILWSVWYEFDLIPDWCKFWKPLEDIWMAPWLRYQIFTPILLLLFLNLFWYYLIWRIVFRTLSGTAVRDEREDEDEDDEDDKKQE